jgi:hypothetical protein
MVFFFNFIIIGQEEKDYWNKLEADRNIKFSSKPIKKKRGSQKVEHVVLEVKRR